MQSLVHLEHFVSFSDSNSFNFLLLGETFLIRRFKPHDCKDCVKMLRPLSTSFSSFVSFTDAYIVLQPQVPTRATKRFVLTTQVRASCDSKQDG